MFWENYVRLCSKKGKAPNVVAREVCGVKSTGTVTGWKNGALPRSDIRLKLSEYFGIPWEEIVNGPQKKNPTALEGDGINGVDLSKLSPARQKLLEAVNGMTDDKIMALLRVIEAVNREMPE